MLKMPFRVVRWLRRLLVGVVALYLALWGVTLYIHYPAPIDAARLGFADPSATGKLMPSEPITAKLPVNLQTDLQTGYNENITVSYNGQPTDLESVLAATKTNAFLIIRNGQIVREQYFNGFDQYSELPSYSVAKSVVSILAGQLIADGYMSESDTFVGWLPQYKTGTDYDKITIRQLLDMMSGVAVSDDYPTGPEGWFRPIAQMYGTTDMDSFIKAHRDLFWQPGSDSEYRSVDTQMVGMVIEEVTGKSLPDLMTNGYGNRPGLWQAIHAEHDGTWNVDHVGGTAKAFCCLNITARDYAKLGIALLHGLQQTDNSVIPEAWAARMGSTVTKLDHDWGYSAFTWHPYPGVSMFLGLHGQIVLIDPGTDTVMVKLSDASTDAAEAPTVEMMKKMLDARAV